MEISKIINKRSLLIAVLLVALGVGFRLLPHEANFAPIAAIALMSGALLGRKYALAVLLSIMVISDLIIGTYSSMLFTWSAFALIALYGTMFKNSSFTKRVFVGSLGSASLFFIVSNFGVWVSSGMYAHTIAGFVNCYAMAIPFFRATLVSDFVYSGALFGIAILATKTHRYATVKLLRPTTV